MKKLSTGFVASGDSHPEKPKEPGLTNGTLSDGAMKEQSEMLSSHANYAINSQLAERIARVCGAVWVHNLASSGTESMSIITPEVRSVETPLKPSDVGELIDAYLLPVMKLVHKEAWKLTTMAELELWLGEDGMLSDYGIAKWGMLVNYIATHIDSVGYGDAKH